MARSARKPAAEPKPPRARTTRRPRAVAVPPPPAHDEIARLAHELWLADGSRTPEENWLAAECQLEGTRA